MKKVTTFANQKCGVGKTMFAMNIGYCLAKMGHVTQQNAANAEESASASEEMNAQAEQMKGVVGELIALVGGSTKEVGNREYAVGRKEAVGRKAGTGIHKALAAPAKKAGEKEVGPDEVIPMDEADFKEF